jgi:hypothetical protein
MRLYHDEFSADAILVPFKTIILNRAFLDKLKHQQTVASGEIPLRANWKTLASALPAGNAGLSTIHEKL